MSRVEAVIEAKTGESEAGSGERNWRSFQQLQPLSYDYFKYCVHIILQQCEAGMNMIEAEGEAKTSDFEAEKSEAKDEDSM
eukprot:9245627-Alexandrium_andersonii.AAC.1